MKFYWVRADLVINLEAIKKVDVAGRAVCWGDGSDNWLLLTEKQFYSLMDALRPHMVNERPPE